MRHAAFIGVVLAGVFAAAPARADEKTWCVGGFKWADANPNSRSISADACGSEQKNRGMPSWHWHDNWFVTKDGKNCYQCWDQTDDTCNSEGVQKNGWRVISLKECRDMGPAPVSKKHFFDPENKWSPQNDPIVVLPLDEPPLSMKLPKKPPDNAVVQQPPPPPPDNAVVQQPPPPPPDPIVPPPVTPDPDNAVAVVTPKPTQPTPPRPTPSTPAKPASIPIQVTLGMRVSPGPYAVNDPVTMTGWAASGGTSRTVTGGFFQWFDPSGNPIAGPDGKPYRVPGKPGPGGTVVATAPAPMAGALTVSFVAGGIVTRGSEVLSGKPDPAQASVEVAQCRLRGVVIAPSNGELIAANAKLKLQLKGRFDTSSNAPSSDLRGANAIFAVEIDGREQRIPATPSGAEYTAEIEVSPPETADTADVSVRLFGEGGASDVCPGTTSVAQLTKLGMAIEAKATKNCYVGKKCPLEATFKFPSDPTIRAAAEKLATAPDLEIIVRRNGTDVGTLAVVTQGDPSSLLTGEWTPLTAGLTDVEVIARSKAQNREVKDTIELKVKEPIELKLPAELDLGTVDAGSAWPAGCKELDFTASRGVIEETFAMKSTLPKGCKSTPALLSNGLGAPLPAGLEVTMDYDSRKLKICLAEVPRCAEENPEPIELTITPKNPDFPDQVVKLKVKWKVKGRNFLACHWWWIAATLGGIGLLLVGYGFIKPYNFAAHDAVKMASDRSKLTRAVGRRLRELPGGRSGWYRHAATGLREDGSTTSKLSQAAVTLSAKKGDVVIKSRGGLQRVHPQSKKLEPLDTGKDGVLASKGVIYVIGDLHFSID